MARKNGKHTSTAVMSRRRADEDNDGLSEEERLWKKLDHYCTPPWGARAGLEHARNLWHQGDPLHLIEPAAGRGHIATPATEYFDLVEGFDIHDYGYGFETRDWMDDRAWPDGPVCDVVFTNPPFQNAEAFLVRALARARLGVGLLCRLAFMEGGERYAILGGPTAHLTQVVTFSERLPMTLGDWDPTAGSATAYAWFFWSKVHDPMAPAWFPPGTRDRLWRRDDPARFGKLTPMALFPEPEPHFEVI